MASSSADALDPAAVGLGRLMDALGLGYALIGGQAVNCWVRPRATADIDFVVLANREAIERVERQLRASGFTWLQRTGGDQPSGPDFVRMELAGTTTIIDFQAAKTEFQDNVVARAISIGDEQTKVATPEDLLVMKLIAGRSKDGDDARRLVALPGLDLEYIRRRAVEWGVEDRLDAIIRWSEHDTFVPPP